MRAVKIGFLCIMSSKHTSPSHVLGCVIQHLRKSKDLSQVLIASKLGMSSQSYYSKVEKEGPWPLERVSNIAIILEIDISWLVRMATKMAAKLIEAGWQVNGDGKDELSEEIFSSIFVNLEKENGDHGANSPGNPGTNL